MFNTRMGKTVGGFQTQVVRRLTGKLPHITTDGRWKYTTADTVRETADFLTMEEYIRRIQNMVTQYIATRDY